MNHQSKTPFSYYLLLLLSILNAVVLPLYALSLLFTIGVTMIFFPLYLLLPFTIYCLASVLLKKENALTEKQRGKTLLISKTVSFLGLIGSVKVYSIILGVLFAIWTLLIFLMKK